MTAVTPASRVTGTRLDAPVPLDGRVVGLPAGRYDWLHLELRAESAGAADCWLYYDGALDPEPLSWAVGEQIRVRMPVARRTELVAVRLPWCPGVELQALSLILPAKELVLV